MNQPEQLYIVVRGLLAHEPRPLTRAGIRALIQKWRVVMTEVTDLEAEEMAQKFEAIHRVRRTHKLNCQVCGQQFEARRRDAQICSDKCRAAKARAKRAKKGDLPNTKP